MESIQPSFNDFIIEEYKAPMRRVYLETIATGISVAGSIDFLVLGDYKTALLATGCAAIFTSGAILDYRLYKKNLARATKILKESM